jgi:transglutaminase-like putative cysteine protease
MVQQDTALPLPTRSWQTELVDVLPGFVLSLIMCGAVIYSLSISNWASGLEILMPMAFPALLAGVVFARLRWMPGWLAHLLSTALAFVWSIRLLGVQMDARLETWRDQATELAIRGLIWTRVLANGGRGEDILLFVAVLCLLCWLLAYASAWFVFRHNWVWSAVLLNAAVILINYTYVLPKPTLLFFIFLGAALLLLVHQHIIQRQAVWEARRIEFPDFLPLRFTWAAALVCSALVAVTALLPGDVSIDRATATWETISRPFKLARERWEDAFATINAPPGAGSGSFTSRAAALGGSRQLTDAPVMEVRSLEFDYWRAVAFDKYDNGEWQNTTGEQARAILGAAAPEQARSPRGAGQPHPVGNIRGRREVAQVFRLMEDRQDDLIMVGGTALKISLPTLVEHNYIERNGEREPNFDDSALIVAQDDLRAGTAYTVTALVSRVDIQTLRSLGDDYPAWVRDRYLQLPNDLAPRIREQAIRIINEAGATTPYDRAIAIQDYLRTIPYNERIPAPPAGVDPVDWFLFEQREGYCDYYASSMALMLRTLGIPARWVRGYAGGDFDPERGIYVVRENVAHSWPEVYFPGVGWERFEPTPADYTALPLRPLTGVFGEDLGDFNTLPPGFFDDDERFDDLDEGLPIEPGPIAGGELHPRHERSEQHPESAGRVCWRSSA